MTKEEIKMTRLKYNKHTKTYTYRVITDVLPFGDSTITKDLQIVFAAKDVKKMSVGDLAEVLDFAAERDYKQVGDTWRR